MRVPVRTLPHFEGLELPRYETAGSSGMDLRAATIEGSVITLNPGERVLIPTGIKIALRHGVEAQVRTRSGLALKKGLVVLNSPGTIDADYRGEIGVILCNLSKVPCEISRGDKIAQLVFSLVETVSFDIVNELEDTQRGSGGFGSTGV